MTHGALFFALRNSSANAFSDSPNSALMISTILTLIKLVSASFATAFASIVFPKLVFRSIIVSKNKTLIGYLFFPTCTRRTKPIYIIRYPKERNKEGSLTSSLLKKKKKEFTYIK